MSGHTHFMLSKKCLALAPTIDDSLSHTVTHFLTQKADINPIQPFCPDAHTNRETLHRHTFMKAIDALPFGNQCHIAFRVFQRLIRQSSWQLVFCFVFHHMEQ